MNIEFSDKERIIDVFFFDESNGMFIDSGPVHVAPYTGLPPGCTTIEPPEEKENTALCYDQTIDKWHYVADYRGQTVWNKETAQPFIVNTLGDIPEGFTAIEPATPYDKWNGVMWVTDKEAEKNAKTFERNAKRAELMEEAEARITRLMRAKKYGIATEQEEELLEQLEIYTVLLARVDTTKEDCEFPPAP